MMKLILLSAALISCFAFLLARQASSDMPRTVSDNAGHRFRMRVAGEGSPAVVMEIGLGGPCEEWAMVQREVAKFTRVAAYDRLASHRKERTLTGRQIAEEFHTALANAHVPPPYILVGQSFGGVYNRIFAQMYPSEVVGMVLLDPTTEKFVEYMEAHHREESASSFKTEDWPEGAGIFATLAELDNAALPDISVVVVTAARPYDRKLYQEMLPLWKQFHENFANSLLRGRHIITEKSGHGIQHDQPELVVELIRQMFEESKR